MRRTAWMASALLVLGLLSTVAVAWGAAIFIPIDPRSAAFFVRRLGPDEGGGRGTLYLSILRSPGTRFVQAVTIGETVERGTPRTPEQAVPYWAAGVLEWEGGPGQRFLRALSYEARGWPLPALRCLHDPTIAPMPPQRVLGGIMIPKSLEALRIGTGVTTVAPALPYRPIALGLATDTVFFASLWGVVLVVPGAVRRRRRRSRGQCVRCGYDLAGSTRGSCPECGHRAPSGSATASQPMLAP